MQEDEKEKFTFKIIADEGYEGESVKADNVDIPKTANDNEYEIVSVTGKTEIIVTYKELPKDEKKEVIEETKESQETKEPDTTGMEEEKTSGTEKTDVNTEENTSNEPEEKKEESEQTYSYQQLLLLGPDIVLQEEYFDYFLEEGFYTEEEIDEMREIARQYKELVLGRGSELAAIAFAQGTKGFTEEELAIYNAYQDYVLNGGPTSSIATMSIEGGTYNGKNILEQGRKNFGSNSRGGLRYLKSSEYDNEYNNNVVYNQVKYVDSDGDGNPKNGDKVAYCLSLYRGFSNNLDYSLETSISDNKNVQRVYNQLLSEMAYAVSIGCKEYGGHNNEAYSTGEDAYWAEDYYVTQTVLYIILYDYINGDFNKKDLTQNEIDEVKRLLGARYSGHSFGSLETNPETATGYAERSEPVLDAVDRMYRAVQAYRANMGDSGMSENDRTDASIKITPGNLKLKYNNENGHYEGSFTITTTGTMTSDEITITGLDGKYVKKIERNRYTISIPAADVVKNDNLKKFSITAQANFEKKTTATYISTNPDYQNVTFFEDTVDSNIEKTAEAKVSLDLATVSIKVTKTGDDNETPLSGAVFGVYTDKACTDSHRLGTITTDNNGTATLENINIGYGKVYLKELTAPAGHKISNSNAIEVNLGFVANKEVNQNVSNEAGNISISKKEITTKQELPGASLQIVDENDRVVTTAYETLSWISGNTPKVIKGLPAGSYKLQEVAAPSGYKIANEIAFTIGEDLKVVGSSTNTVTMLDEKTKVSFAKVDAGTKEPVEGATLTLYDSDNRELYSWDSEETLHEIEGLAPGTYYLEESGVPEGYIKASDIVFKIDQDGTVTVNGNKIEDGVICMEDDVTRVTINKVDEEGKPVVGAKLVIKDEYGKLITNEDGTPKYSYTTDGKEIQIAQMPAGNYILSEIEAPDGYQVSADVPFTVSNQTNADNTVKMTDKKEEDAQGKITVTKTLSIGDLPIGAEDVTFYVALFSDEAKTKKVSNVKALVFYNQDATSVIFDNLKPGTYYIGETDEYGNLIDSEAEFFEPQYIDGDKAEITPDVVEVEKTINNRFSELPDGYYYQGTLTITKKVLKGTEAWNTDNVYYAGVFEDPEYKQLVMNPIELRMNGGSETTETVKVSLGTDPETTVVYYVTETDANGVPLDNNSGLEFTVSVDGSVAEMSANDNQKTITITNTYEDDGEGYYEEDDESGSETKTTKSSKTGDDSKVGTYSLLLLCAGAIMILTFWKRRKRA